MAARAKQAIADMDGLLSQAIDVGELEDPFIKMVLFGQNRTGKTTLACQFPKPLLLVSFEPAQSGGATSVRNVKGVKYLRLTKASDAEALAKELEHDTNFKSHVIDGVTNLERMHLADILGDDMAQLPTGISTDQYVDRAERTKSSLKRFLDLAVHTVLICREKDHSKPSDRFVPKMLRGVESNSFFASELGGASVGWVHDVCDFICQLQVVNEIKTVTRKVKVLGKEKVTTEEVETGRKIRRLRTTLDVNYAGGFRSANPEMVPEFIMEPSWAKIKAAIDGLPQPK